MALTDFFSRRRTRQSEQADPKQRRNAGGGFSFVLDDAARLDRFLILGSDRGTYYVSARALTIANARCVERCLASDGPGAVEQIARVSEQGRAAKNDAAIFALAIAAGHADPSTRAAALAAIPRVCRISTHLFQFVDAVQHFRGWGRGLRRAIARWYLDKDPQALAYQVVKYQGRAGWSHRDVLRKAGGAIGPHSLEHEAVLRFVVDGLAGFDRDRTIRRGEREVGYGSIARDRLPELILAVDELNHTSDPRQAAALIRRHRLTHEMVPGQLKQSAEVWAAMLEHMPTTAMVRSLGKLTEVGVLAPFSDATKQVVAQLGSPERLAKARLHPLAVLTALRIYARGRGERGKLSWTPVSAIVDALDRAFYACFANVEPAGKRTLLALDVSGSMGAGEIAGLPGITPAVGSAAMAMLTLAREPQVESIAFSTRIEPVQLRRETPLDQVVRQLAGIPMGGTDCAQPMLWAHDRKLPVDTFVVYTDSETWHGQIHPHQALQRYRDRMGIPAKLIVVGMTATEFSIANPDDAGMLDVVGFDTAAPAIMAGFSRA
ncbi:TROVE domain-containing protein [Nannocystaceae bacterium ST9]